MNTPIDDRHISELAKFPEINPWPVVRLDTAGMVVMANGSARKLFRDESLIGKDWKKLCPEIDEALWKSILHSNSTITHESSVRDCIILFSYVLSEARDVVYAFGADVTAHREIERQLEKQSAVLKEVARFPEMNPGPVIRLDHQGYILLANAAARKVFGEEIIGICWLDLFPALSQDLWKTIKGSTAETQFPVEATIGECNYVFTHRRDEKSNLIFVFGSDITFQKKTELALRQSEKMATLGTLAAGVAHELNNPAAATRRAADHLRTAFLTLERFYSSREQQSFNDHELHVHALIEQMIADSAGRYQQLDPLERSDRETALEEWFEDKGFSSLTENITALVDLGITVQFLEEHLSECRIEQFSTILERAGSVFPVMVLLHEIGQGASRISEIVGALKGYSFLGQAPIQSVDLHQGIENTLVILRNKMKKGITLVRQYGESIPKIMAYGSELNQVWTNILDNAIDAMQGSGTIKISTSRTDQFVQVEIHDNGPGIPDAIQHRIFDPFFTTKEPGKGTGLGLATTYGIVTEKHRGTITVTSRPGDTCFLITLPIDAAKSTAS